MIPERGALLLADGGDGAAWRRAEALAQAWRREGKNVLLRDAAPLDTALRRLAHATPHAEEGSRHLLRIQYRNLCDHFALEGAVRIGAPAPELARFFGDMTNMVYREVPDAELPDGEAGPSGPGVLIATNDIATCPTKTSEHLRQGCAELGLATRVEDTGPFRVVALAAREDEAIAAAGRDEARRHFAEAVARGNVGAVVALDLNWFLDPEIFLDDPRVGRIASLWYDDVKAWCQASYNNCFPGAIDKLREALRHPKVVHCCYGRAQMEEMRVLGHGNVRFSPLAAPSSCLRRHAAPVETRRAAFLGNPGLNVAPRPETLALLERRAELPEIRDHARALALRFARHHFAMLIDRDLAVFKWLALALEAKLAHPHASAASLLRTAAVHHPEAMEAVNASGEILNALVVVKMVNQFDRPALVHRLHRAGLLDVFSRPDEWAPYGIASRPDIPFPALPAAYQDYSVHLNGYNAARDATANEKLFEIAACGRVSVNLDTPDVRECYDEGEVAFAGSLEEAEARTRALLADPDGALAMGARARSRTAREHLWSHRLRDLLMEK